MPVPVEEATVQHYVQPPFIVATLKIDLNDGSRMFPSQTVMVPTELQDLSGHEGSVLSADGLSRRQEGQRKVLVIILFRGCVMELDRSIPALFL